MDNNEFDALRITLASPKQILSWSHGEVKKAETINYRTQRAEVDGLMCEKIFGPTKNYQCYCGKYKKIRYKGIICDKCGVEVTHKRVRRERMGHIKLAAPVVHIWFSYGIPNKLSLLLNIPKKHLEAVIYFARYIVTSVDEDKKEAVRDEVEEKREDELEKLENDLEKEIKDKEKEIKDKLDELKEEENAGLTMESLKRRGNKKIASMRELYARKEMGIQQRYKKLLKLIDDLKVGGVISEEQYNDLLEYGSSFFEVQMGGEGIKTILSMLDLKKEIRELKKAREETGSKVKKKKIVRRLRIIKGMHDSGVDPVNMVMTVIPVLPPALRPIIQLPGGRFATSDLNDLYRRVINRNNRLQRLIDLGAPEIILRNEKRMLQEAVDALIDNSHRGGRPFLNSRRQPYKALADILRGKQGRFRRNLLGKRVDYSGRSVIVSGPDLGLYECGLPKTVVLELFKPFVIREIIARGLSPNIKSAKNYLEEQSSEVWDILEEVIKGRPVLLNRAPTLHKQGIQAFYPKLIEGNAIRVHPLICKGYNADFDGDQMAVHVPISKAAVDEAIEKMMPDSNMLLMANGKPVITLTKEILFGVYLLTQREGKDKEQRKKFSSTEAALGAYDLNQVEVNENIDVLIKGKVYSTTVGRIIFNLELPEDYGFVNEQIDGEKASEIIADCIDRYGRQRTIEILDYFKTIGFTHATRSGFSVGMDDLVTSEKREELLQKAEEQVSNLNESYYNGLITEDEMKSLSEEIWMKTTEEISDYTWNVYEKESNVYDLEVSGSYPVKNPARQISGIRGLILDPLGNIVELPLRSNYSLGLNSLEYFVASRGTRKGLTDTALKTSGSGYLTRKMIDVSHDVITRIDDCETDDGIKISKDQNRRVGYKDRLVGRLTAEEVKDEEGDVIVEKNCEISEAVAKNIIDHEINEVKVRSPLTCKAKEGVCTMCYGYNLGTRELVEKGVAVGVIAAQAMGEAATQLTLDTKHLAGRAGTDITQGLPRVEELFEARVPKGKALLAEINGKVKIEKDEDDNPETIIIRNVEVTKKTFEAEEGDEIIIKKDRDVNKNKMLIKKEDGTKIKAPYAAKIKLIGDNKLEMIHKDIEEEEYKVSSDEEIIVEDGDNVVKGTHLTVGSIDPNLLMELEGIKVVEQYIINNIQETYGLQGISIDDVHVEVLVRKMVSSVKVKRPGDSDYLPGEYVDYYKVLKENGKLEDAGKQLITYKRELLGITSASIKTESFLSAASFQEVVRVLSDAALVGKEDRLRGLKENVIIGSLVPLGEYLR